MLVGLGTLRISFGILCHKLVCLCLNGISSLLLLALGFCLTLASFSFSFFLSFFTSLALLFSLSTGTTTTFISVVVDDLLHLLALNIIAIYLCDG